MYETKLKFYFVYFHPEDLTLFGFKKEVISLFKDPLYEFSINNLYYIHLFDFNARIIGKFPFKLFSLNDNEDCMEDYYNKLVAYVSIHLKNREYCSYTESLIGLYISVVNEEKIDPKYLSFQKEYILNNILKMHTDLLLPINLNK